MFLKRKGTKNEHDLCGIFKPHLLIRLFKPNEMVQKLLEHHTTRKGHEHIKNKSRTTQKPRSNGF